MQSFIENLLNSTPVELTASIISWFIIFVVVGTCARLVANYYSQGKFQRSKRSVLKEETTKLSGATLFMALFTGIAGMGTMFAVNELIKTNKMVAESTEAAVRAAESAEIQTQEAIISNLISANQKHAEYTPIIDIQSDYNFSASKIVNKAGGVDLTNICRINVDIVNKSGKPTWLEGLYFQAGPFFIERDITIGHVDYYYKLMEDVKTSETNIIGSAHLNKGINRIIETTIKGSDKMNISFCQDSVSKKPILGGGLLISSSTGVTRSLFIYASLIYYEVNKYQKVTHAPELYQLKVIGKSSRFKDADDDLPGYVISRNSSYYDKSFDKIYPTLANLMSMHMLFVAASYDLMSDNSKSLDVHLASKLKGTKFNSLCENEKSSCQVEFIQIYEKLTSEVLSSLENNKNYKIESLRDANKRLNSLPICEEMGYGYGCQSLLKKRKKFLP